jgi:hypothetical protein
MKGAALKGRRDEPMFRYLSIPTKARRSAL